MAEIESKYMAIGPTDTYSITFFYVSDLVDLIMKEIENAFSVKEQTIQSAEKPESVDDDNWEALKENQLIDLNRKRDQYKKLRVVFGPIEIVNPKNPSESKSITIGDLPISTKYFREWMAKKIEQEDDNVFSLASFLNQFLMEFINDTLNSDVCFGGQLRQTTRLFQAAVTAYKPLKDVDELSKKIQTQAAQSFRFDIDQYQPEQKSILNVSGDPETPGGRPADGQEREIHYLIFYAGRVQPKEQQGGNRAADEARGVFHYGIGQDSGIVKTINFQRQSAPSLKMVRFEQEGYDGLQQLREQYNVSIKTYANVKAMPGCYIYVEPNSFSPSSDIDLTSLGVGGYHMISKSEHRFAPGVAESTLTAVWVHSKDQDFETQESADDAQKPSDPIKKGKCEIKPLPSAEATT